MHTDTRREITKGLFREYRSSELEIHFWMKNQYSPDLWNSEIPDSESLCEPKTQGRWRDETYFLIKLLAEKRSDIQEHTNLFLDRLYRWNG